MDRAPLLFQETQAEDEFTCQDCNQIKPTKYNAKGEAYKSCWQCVSKVVMLCSQCGRYTSKTFNKAGQPYEICKLCFNKKQQQFWSTKRYKKCKTCKKFVSLSQYQYSQHGSPYPNCQTCYAASSQA